MHYLEIPGPENEQAYRDLIAEWSSHETTPTSPSKLFAGKDYQDFLDIVSQDVRAEAPKVSAHLFFLMESTTQRILGAIQIRHHIDHPNLIETGGHIGYGVRPTERGKGYATEMLQLALREALHLGLQKVLVTCDEDNIASQKVIESNGGIFERLGEKDGHVVRRYWIDVKPAE